MPCGGIDKYLDIEPGKCWQCGKDGATHYCHEWDCMLHADCVIPFLATDEGQVLVHHGHTVVIHFEDSQQVLEEWKEMEDAQRQPTSTPAA